MVKTNRKYTKITFTISLLLTILWAVLGTGTSLAWFTDTTPVAKNVFTIGELDLVVSKRLDNGNFAEIKNDTAVFDDEALYEPGYLQVVVLKVENKGDVPFDYKTAVTVTDYTTAQNSLGSTFNLHEHLKFGMITADTYAELQLKIKDRQTSKTNANEEMPLNTYFTETESLEVDGVDFVALIVRMPETETNVANYRGNTKPRVELGLNITASQQGTLQ